MGKPLPTIGGAGAGHIFRRCSLALTIETRALAALIPFARNSRTHSAEQVDQIAASIREFGWTNPILIDGQNGIIAGHGRLAAARKLGLADVPVIILNHLTDTQQRALIIADNKLALNAGWDTDLLASELADLQGDDFDLTILGFSDAEISDLLAAGDESGDGTGDGSQTLSDRFLIAPFSVLNAREGWWQDRKRAWLAMGIQSDIGRNAPTFATEGNASDQNGTSIFDPVLCEIAYRWFCPPAGLVLDPFAGGSVRGIVAAKLGREYIGHELRAEQVEANRAQADAICAPGGVAPAWIIGDSRAIDRTCADVDADFVFSCPPYADLEVYSDDPADLSTLGYDDFRDAYREIIAKACARLKPDRFACFVVGEVRDKRGAYRDFVGDTVQAFRDAGLAFYNEAILVTALGSLPVRVGRQFSASRKLGKTHQNVLIFCKGDAKRAADACGVVDCSDALEAAADGGD